VEEERRARVGLELARLAARVTRVKREAALVERLQQDHADARLAVRRRGRDRHRLRHLDPVARLVEPQPELRERVVEEVVPPKRACAEIVHVA
jgi:hypothetical protein